MKKTTLIAILLFIGIVQQAVAKNGYHIHLKMSEVDDSMVYLAHYYGKGGEKVYKTDSARFDKNGVADMKSNDPDFTGGIYMLFLSDKKTVFELLLDKGDDISITANKKKLPESIKFKNSPENDRFEEYVNFSKVYGEGQQKLQKEYNAARTAADTAEVRRKAAATAKDLIHYREDYIKKYPGTLLASIFGAMEVPEVPEGQHYLEDGKTKDSTFAYTYYKAHYWDGFNFQDDRLIYTPIYDPKLDEYINKEVLPWPDSLEKECDMLLKKAKGSKDVFHYTLWWLTYHIENSKIMGMDEVFVYLVENYYMKGDATWLTNEELQKYLDRAQKIAPNVIGNVAPEIKLPNVLTKKEETLSEIKAKYTIVVFYSPTCGHCQHELPLLDSVYRAELKKKGVVIYTIATEGDEKSISDFLNKNKLTDWTNTYDPEGVRLRTYKDKYDVYSTPTIYLLDEKKIIRGKRLDHTNIPGLMEQLEKKAKDKNKERGGEAKP
jgi:thiol-disulfide isomerase/thioredoxin